MQLAVTVLTFTAGLTLVHTLAVNRLTNGLAVRNLRRAYVRLNLKLAQKSVNDNIKVQLAHARNNGLTGLLVGVGLKGGVLFGKLNQRQSHFFLTRLCFRLD